MQSAARALVPLISVPTTPLVTAVFASASNDQPVLTPMEKIIRTHPDVQQQRVIYTPEHIRQMQQQQNQL